MYESPGQRSGYTWTAGAHARQVPVAAHQGDHWDFLRRLEQAGRDAAQGSREQQGEFARTLLTHTADFRNLQCAIESIIAKGERAPGSSGLRLETLNRFEQRDLIQILRQAILNQFQPGPCLRMRIPKPGKSGTRPLEIPEADSKVVQRALVQVLQPWLDPTFDDWSFGFRPGLGREHALITAELTAYRADKWCWITEDIQDAFTMVPHGRLLDLLALRGLDRKMVELNEQIIANDRHRGLPQGGPLSPLLLNIYLDHFLDSIWRQRYPHIPLIRVADDLLLLCENTAEAQQAYANLEQLLHPAGLPLKIGPGKAIRNLQDGIKADWLGYRIGKGNRGLDTHIGTHSWEKLTEKLTVAHRKPDPPLRAIETIGGWISQLGATYRLEDHQKVYERITRIANGLTFESYRHSLS